MKKITIILAILGCSFLLQCTKEENRNDESLSALALVTSSGEPVKTDSGITDDGSGTTTDPIPAESKTQTVTLDESFWYNGSVSLTVNKDDVIQFTTSNGFSNLYLSISQGQTFAASCSGQTSSPVSCGTSTYFTADSSVSFPNFTLTALQAGTYSFNFHASESKQISTPSYTVKGNTVNLTETFIYLGELTFSLIANQKIQFVTESNFSSVSIFIDKEGYQTSTTSTFSLFDICSGTSTSSAFVCYGNTMLGGSNATGMFVPDSSVLTPNFTLSAPEIGNYTFNFQIMTQTRATSSVYTGTSLVE